jgi:uncharacterized protein (DUF302 family)
MTPYGFGITVPLQYGEAIQRIRDALATQGFGILTEIDVAATLKKKLDIDFRPYVILGACNPSLAYQALTAERDIGLLLPCNVIVYGGDEPGTSVVAVLDPVAALALTGRSDIRDLASDVRRRLELALAVVGQTPAESAS